MCTWRSALIPGQDRRNPGAFEHASTTLLASAGAMAGTPRSGLSGADKQEGGPSPFMDELRPTPHRLSARDGLQYSFDGQARIDEPVEQRRDRAMVFPHAFDEPALLAEPLLRIVIQGPVHPSPLAIEHPAFRRIARRVDRMLGRIDQY